MCSRLQCAFRIGENLKGFFLRAFSFACYMYIGAFVFMKIEQEPARRQSDENGMKMEILKKRTTAEYNMTERQFTELVNELKPLLCSNVPKWSYDQATSFTLQLLTTIGYGNITPRTAPGQIGAIVYAIFGIPLTLLTLKSFGKLCNILMKYFITMVEKCVTKQPEIQNLEVKVLVLNIVALNAVIFISAIVSCYKDGWEMREGVYVWFITFTTVGFGDLIPTMMTQGFQPNSSIIPGLCFMSGVVDAMVECVTCLKVFPCRGNFFSWIFCCNCCGSYHVNNAIENLEAPGNPLRNFGSEESNGFQESGNSSLAK